MATRLLFIFLSAILINNFVLSRFLGICPFLGVSKKVDTAVGMSIAVIFVMILASIITWLLNILLVSLGLSFLTTIVFILIIATLVQFVEIVLKKTSPALYEALGIFLPLITTNCAILGLALLNVQQNYTLIETIVNSAGAGLGFALALILFSTIRERMELSDIPAPFKGTASALITAGLLSMAFMGFQGLVKL
ncbi:MAG TPA: electron transport complex subunit RsxA [Mesotoga infera]|jgi:electron transport complex protein RnfA|uniref:Ion-translocating oxidoreductase complex subunit A n=1 Tax=Mesotoga infera TaxID=1236046 RepID=A0A7Z7LHR2_9BACT|nr:electron transport complex subunit RsxA [Mesotoga infera]MBP8659776.1 electron transport complex subunit RsxA [Mesotoga sp.]NLI06597.1 electron transport complex subunit RsxA [Thermotogaceae bacterium]SSC14138.1 putative inner membrane subunit of an electron transport system [Mesotoga infera]HNS66336.1 electron transport complex subunit RsxA [Mesotoga infera]HOI33647.1 electron transport complex subunit RsxA [Mesotoga infera]